MSIIKIYLNVPLRKVPFGGIFRFGKKFYVRGVYSHRSRVYVCSLDSTIEPYHPISVCFSPSEVVQYYKSC